MRSPALIRNLKMSVQVEEMSVQAEDLARTAEQLKALVRRFRLGNAPATPAADNLRCVA